MFLVILSSHSRQKAYIITLEWMKNSDDKMYEFYYKQMQRVVITRDIFMLFDIKWQNGKTRIIEIFISNNLNKQMYGIAIRIFQFFFIRIRLLLTLTKIIILNNCIIRF